jgi:NADH:ubiquinone oxidoreductase subunit B-like Fe-S oxidoreductase
MSTALKRTYEAMPSPKFVITAGDCALDGGPFKGSYYIVGGVSKILPVDFHIPGCPPKPIDLVLALLSSVKNLNKL